MHATGRTFVATAAAATAVGAAALAAAPAAAAYSHPQTFSYTAQVRADDADGQVVGTLTAGQWLKVRATRGQADCNVDDGSDTCLFDADGSPTPAPDDWLAPGLREFSLVGVVGAGDPVQLGTHWVTLYGPGPVTVAYNDLLGAYDDDRGTFSLLVVKCTRSC